MSTKSATSNNFLNAQKSHNFYEFGNSSRKINVATFLSIIESIPFIETFFFQEHKHLILYRHIY